MSASDFLSPPPEEPFDIESLINEGDAFDMRRVAVELANRKMEALKLYSPMPVQGAFHKSMAKERIARGGNRSGKTVAAAKEVAAAVTGQDTFGRYPKENGICYCVGFDGRHIGATMWKKLGRPGAFRIIRDRFTKQWRAFLPNDPDDASRIKESRPAPALIPQRMIADISWLLKKENQPQQVKLANGWEIHFFSGNAKPPQGSTCHLAWFDEEVADSAWYNEIAARLVDENGYFIWSATPQAGTDQLYRLHERALEQEQKNILPRTVEEFIFHIDNNIYMTEENRIAFIDKLDEEEKDVRISGEFAKIFRVFPEYNPKYHEIQFRDIPEDWTRYVAIDPGRQVCAALFIAIPHPGSLDSNREAVYIYDELYIRDCDAVRFADAMAVKCKDQFFRAFIIDPNESIKHETGSGLTIEEQYRKQLKERGVKSQLSGHGFLMGDDNRRAGVEAIRSWLRARSGRGTYEYWAVARIIAEKCPNLIFEIKQFRYRTQKIGSQKIVTDDPDERKRTHLVACARYLAQYAPKWHERPKQGAEGNSAYKAHQRKQERANKNSGGLMLGPGR